MPRLRVSCAIVRTVLVAGLASLYPNAAQNTRGAEPGKRMVGLEIVFPNRTPPAQLTIPEGESGTLRVDDVGTFDFVPSFEKGETSVVTVTILDASTSPHRRLGQVKAPIKGKAVDSKTKPPFTIRVFRVIEAK